MSVRFRGDELILRDGTVVCFAGGCPGAPNAASFKSLREMNRAIVKAVFNEYIRRGVSMSKAYSEAAWECGYESPSAVQKIIAEK